jgi:hypothetical protein
MKLDLNYISTEDRMSLSAKGQGGWLIIRSLLLKLVAIWIEKLQRIDLPPVGFFLVDIAIGQEHALSLEFDAPTTCHLKQEPEAQTRQVKEVTLSEDAVGAKLIIRGGGTKTNLTLTRKESHLVWIRKSKTFLSSFFLCIAYEQLVGGCT